MDMLPTTNMAEIDDTNSTITDTASAHIVKNASNDKDKVEVLPGLILTTHLGQKNLDEKKIAIKSDLSKRSSSPDICDFPVVTPGRRVNLNSTTWFAELKNKTKDFCTAYCADSTSDSEGYVAPELTRKQLPKLSKRPKCRKRKVTSCESGLTIVFTDKELTKEEIEQYKIPDAALAERYTEPLTTMDLVSSDDEPLY